MKAVKFVWARMIERMKFRRAFLDEALDEVTGTVVVIDVLRAFTTAAYALQEGAEEIIPEFQEADLDACLQVNRLDFAMIAAPQECRLVMRY